MSFIASMRLLVFVALLLPIVGKSPASAMGRCPPQSTLLANAKTVVEARVKSLWIGESGFLFTTKLPARMVRADLEIKRVAKGSFDGKEATVYGFLFLPGPLHELSTAALLYGYGNYDSFELELSPVDVGNSETKLYLISDCTYSKFPDFKEVFGGR